MNCCDYLIQTLLTVPIHAPQSRVGQGGDEYSEGEGGDGNGGDDGYEVEDQLLQEQYDRDMDRAILESEKERDVIQVLLIFATQVSVVQSVAL